MPPAQVLKLVFPLLDGVGLACCMTVCKSWRDICQDEYLWKCVCERRWPSISKRPHPPTSSYYKLYRAFCRHPHHQDAIPIKLSFEDLEFFVDIWSENELIFSQVIAGFDIQNGIIIPPLGIKEVLGNYLESSKFKMVLLLESNFSVHPDHSVCASVLVGRKDVNMVACITNKSVFNYVDSSAYRAMAYDYLVFSPDHSFVSGIRAWISLLFMEDEGNGVLRVFGIELDFGDVANTKEKVLLLLDMLLWK